jgi:hypothetical protein
MKSKKVEKSEDLQKPEEFIDDIASRLNELHEKYVETKEGTPYS